MNSHILLAYMHDTKVCIKITFYFLALRHQTSFHSILYHHILGDTMLPLMVDGYSDSTEREICVYSNLANVPNRSFDFWWLYSRTRNNQINENKIGYIKRGIFTFTWRHCTRQSNENWKKYDIHHSLSSNTHACKYTDACANNVNILRRWKSRWPRTSPRHTAFGKLNVSHAVYVLCMYVHCTFANKRKTSIK